MASGDTCRWKCWLMSDDLCCTRLGARRRCVGFRWGRGAMAEKLARLALQGEVRRFPAVPVRGDLGDLTQEGARRLELAHDRAVLGGVDEFDLAMLAHADAGLRRFDAAAADALPRLDGLVCCHEG